MARNGLGSGKLFTVILSIIALSGCVTGPDFLRPLTAADNSTDGFINDLYREDGEYQSISRWWERVDDPILNSYVEQLLSDNLQLVQAAERITQAQAQRRIAGGAYYPTLGASGSGGCAWTATTTCGSRPPSGSQRSTRTQASSSGSC